MAPGPRDRYNQLRNTEEQRNKLVEELLDENDRLKNDLEKTTHRLERDSDTVELYQQRSKEANTKFDTLQRLTDSNAYICVLIDGDCTNFRDQLVEKATVGGQDAARLLRSAIAGYARGLGLPQNIEILLYIYANVYRLIKVYRDSQILHEPGDVDRFISGFNKSYPLLNFVDAGNGQECTSSKIRHLFTLHVHNLHCKHIVLGGSSINGYARLLDKYVDDKVSQNRITLLEGPPFAKEISRISPHFKIKSFNQVFRNAKIEIAIQGGPSGNRDTFAGHSSVPYRNILADRASPTDRFLEALDTNPMKDYGKSPEYSRRSSLRDNGGGKYHGANPRYGANSSPRSEPEVIAYPPEYFTDAPFGFIARNRKGQRVDVPLTQPAVGMINEIKRRKLCNDFCLRGRCQIPQCKHEHAKNLSQMELHVLRDVARSFPCPAGLHCNDKDCFHGHRCPVDPCGFVRDRICRYPPELHETDRGIVNKEDLEQLDNDLRDESHILGAATKPNGSVSDARSFHNEPRRNRHGEPLYRNVTMKFDNTPESGPRRGSSERKRPSTGSMQPPAVPIVNNGCVAFSNGSPTASSELNIPGPIVKQEDRPSIGIPISPLKRTADEAGYEARDAASPSTDPRLSGQKRAREESA